jgi:hypothetical protein
MSKTIWHKGPPPSIGWWPASWGRLKGAYRWWNGHEWSVAVSCRHSAREAAAEARVAAAYQERVEWTDRPKHWPKRSRT